VTREGTPPVIPMPAERHSSLRPSVPVPPSTVVAPRRLLTGPETIGVGSGRGRSCAPPTTGHTNSPPRTPKTVAAKLKPYDFCGA